LEKNPFNLTTKRYTDADIASFIAKGSYIFCLNVKDKFGDSGITGCFIANKNEMNVEIDSFLLSCRVLGRGIEIAFLNSILNILKKQGITKVYSYYSKTPKNTQTVDFYDKTGFKLINATKGEKFYMINLEEHEFEIASCYKIIYKI
jgi:FkbH-like protein